MANIMQELMNDLEKVKRGLVLMVGIDGVDASGKTTFADHLASCTCNRPIIRLSIDSFHNPKAVRTQRGNLSPEGYYEDSFNYDFLVKEVFSKLKSGDLEIHSSSFDYRVDEMNKETIKVPSNAIVLFDGIFLQRPEIKDFFEIKIFLDLPFEEVLNRAKIRDLDYFKDENLLLEKYLKRYIPGQKLYFEKCHPKESADIVIDNKDYNNPLIMKNEIKVIRCIRPLYISPLL